MKSKHLSSIYTTKGGHSRSQIRGYAPKFMRTHRWPLGLVSLWREPPSLVLWTLSIDLTLMANFDITNFPRGDINTLSSYK